jgi:hypothetical protein
VDAWRGDFAKSPRISSTLRPADRPRRQISYRDERDGIETKGV